MPASALTAIAALAKELLREDHVRSLVIEVLSFDQFARHL
jgi:hypothetical protein